MVYQSLSIAPNSKFNEFIFRELVPIFKLTIE